MKNSLCWVLAGILAAGSTGCIYVHVKGDLEELWDDEDDDGGFAELSQAVGESLVDPQYDFDLQAGFWGTDAEWTIRYAGEASDGQPAFHRIKEAVLNRIQRKGGHVRDEQLEGPHAWSCEFRVDGDRYDASVRMVEKPGEDSERPHRIEVRWEEPD